MASSLADPELPSSQSEVLVDEAGALVYYHPWVLHQAEAASLFAELRDRLDWRRERDDFGVQDRLTHYQADTGCTFKFVGLSLPPAPWHPKVDQLRQKLAQMLEEPLSACLLNNYPEGEGFIPWHSDEVRAHGDSRCIATVSLGGPRTFMLQHVADSSRPVISKVLEPGSLLVMSGATEEHWRHQLPLPAEPTDNPGEAHRSAEAPPHRISLTFRTIVAGFEDAGQPMRQSTDPH